MTEREALLRKLSASQFARWELHLFLNTHRDDPEAVKRFKKYDEMTRKLTAEYEEKYGPLTADQSDGCSWLQDPWPWDIDGGDC